MKTIGKKDLILRERRYQKNILTMEARSFKGSLENDVVFEDISRHKLNIIFQVPFGSKAL